MRAWKVRTTRGADQSQAITEFLERVDIMDEVEARRLLSISGWNVDRAVKRYALTQQRATIMLSSSPTDVLKDEADFDWEDCDDGSKTLPCVTAPPPFMSRHLIHMPSLTQPPRALDIIISSSLISNSTVELALGLFQRPCQCPPLQLLSSNALERRKTISMIFNACLYFKATRRV